MRTIIRRGVYGRGKQGGKDVYLYAYGMGPCWQIENILRASYEVILPQRNGQGFIGMPKKKLKMMVSPKMIDKGHHQYDDIIKVFRHLQADVI